MDFKALMSAQISKSKSKPAPSSNASTTPTSSKYQRRADVEREREAAYIAEQARLEREREERASKKRKLEEEEIERNALREDKKRKLAEESRIRREAEETEQERLRRKRLGLPELPPAHDEKDGEDGTTTPLPAEIPDIPDDELRSKLRTLNEPATLFDESHASRLKRYYKLTNPGLTVSKKQKLFPGLIPTTLEPVPEADMLLPTTIPAQGDEHIYLHRQLASYFTLLLREWQTSLALRSPSTSSSSTGQAAMKAYTQVLHDLTPLFRKLETQTLLPALLDPLVGIIHSAQMRHYRDAVDGYLRLSIGKAAWPIGVTMVGIHERSAREKLHASDDKMAHIMSDEVTRKILQSVKRCLSFAQVRWPPEDLGQLMG